MDDRLLRFFDQMPEALSLYQKFEREVLSRVEDVRIKVQKTQITFSNRHVYACASIVGAIACVFIYRSFGAVEAMVGASAVVIVIRYLAAHYHWNLPRLTE